MIVTADSEFTLMEPLDATKYMFDVSVVIDRKLLEAPPCDLCDFNSTQLSLDTEGKCMIFIQSHFFPYIIYRF